MLLILLSAIGKWVVFDYFLEPDGSGRTRLENSDLVGTASFQA